MRTFICAAAMLLVLATLAMPVQAAQGPDGTLLVALKESDQAAVVDLASGKVLRLFATGDNPHELLLAADGRLAVVSNFASGADSLTVFDPADGDSVRQLSLDGHRSPHGMAWRGEPGRLLVTTEGSYTMIDIDLESGEIVAAAAAGRSHMVAIDSSLAVAYTTDGPKERVHALPLDRLAVSKSYPVPSQPEAIAFEPTRGRVWVGSNAHGTVSVLDPNSGQFETVVSGLQWPYRIVFVPTRQWALIPDLSQEKLLAVSTVDHRVVHDLDLAGARPQGIVVTPDGRWAFISLNALDRVAVIDLSDFGIERYLDLPKGSAPDGIAYMARVLAPN